MRMETTYYLVDLLFFVKGLVWLGIFMFLGLGMFNSF